MKYLSFDQLVEQFSGSKDAGVFEFEYTGKFEKNEYFKIIFNGVVNSFVSNLSLIELCYTDNQSRTVIDFPDDDILANLKSMKIKLNSCFFFFGIVENNLKLIFRKFPEIISCYIFRDKTFVVQLSENLFTNELYFFQNGINEDRVSFEPASTLNRKLLAETLKLIEKKQIQLLSNGIVSCRLK